MIKILLGLLLVGLAVREFRNRPRPGQQPQLPGWMRAIDTIGGAKALGIAFLLPALNPKNLSLTVAAAVDVAQEGLSAAGADAASLLAAGESLVALHEWTRQLGPGFVVGVGNGLILGYLMYTSRLVPRAWPCWGSSAVP